MTIMVKLSFKKITHRMGQNSNFRVYKSKEKYTQQFEKSLK